MITRPEILDLASTFVVVEPDHSAVTVPVSASVFEELDRASQTAAT